jgi:hypothetical protein
MSFVRKQNRPRDKKAGALMSAGLKTVCEKKESGLFARGLALGLEVGLRQLERFGGRFDR